MRQAKTNATGSILQEVANLIVPTGRGKGGKPGSGGDDWSSSDDWLRLGFRLLVLLVVFLLGFGTVVSINGAVVSSGIVTVESSYKTVQHLDGGIIAKILVRNGDEVRAGDVLVQLDKGSDRAELTVVTERIDDLRIQRARLEAERDGKANFDIPDGISMSEGISKTIATQRALFAARMETYRGEMSMLSRRIEQVSAQIKGLAAQQTSRAREHDLMRTELVSVRQLYEKGFANQQRLSALERDEARLDGEIGRLAAELARAEGALSETELNLTQRRKTLIETVTDELRKVQSALNELEERRKALDAKVARAEVRAPQAGRVHALNVHTEGGVIEPAKPIMQIIPQNERMVVEARIMPQDIDKVRSGQSARIMFPAFNTHTTPRLNGSVTRVSAAELAGEQGRTYFTAEVEIPQDELAKIGSDHRLLPGMPAEVFITTEARSMMSYFLKPLTDAMFRAFRET